MISGREAVDARAEPFDFSCDLVTDHSREFRSIRVKTHSGEDVGEVS